MVGMHYQVSRKSKRGDNKIFPHKSPKPGMKFFLAVENDIGDYHRLYFAFLLL